MARWWLVLVQTAGVWATCSGLVNNTEDQSLDNAVRVMFSQCRRVFTPHCMQLEFLSQLEHVLTTHDYELLPGVFLSRGNVTSLPLPPGLVDPRASPGDAARVLAPLVAERLFRQLGTWSLSVPVFSNSTLHQLRRMMQLYLGDGGDVQEGRKSKFWKYMAPALMTLAFSILSGLISKSLTMSLIALVLTIVGGRGNFGFGSPPASAPVPALTYRSPPPLRSHVSHSSELQYVDELPDDGAQPYVYVNRKAWKARADTNPAVSP